MYNLINNRWQVRFAILFLLLLFSWENLTSQYADHITSRIDSLEHILATDPPTGLELANYYSELMWDYHRLDYKKSIDYAQKCIETATSIKDWLIVSEGYTLMALVLSYLSQLDSAVICFNHAFDAVEKAKGNVEESKIEDRLSKIYGNLGNFYFMTGKYLVAIDYYYEALKIFEKYDLKENQSTLLVNIGELFTIIDNYSKAEQTLLQADSIATLIGNPGRIASAKLRLGKLYKAMHEYDKALQNLYLAHDYYFSFPDENTFQPIVLNSLADAHLFGFGNDQLAEEYVRRAMQMSEKLDRPVYKSSSLQTLSEIYLRRGDWKNAEKCALESLAITDSQPQSNLALYRILAEAYSYQNKPALAAEYIDKIVETQSQWATQHYQSAISEMEVKYETEKKEMEIERQQQLIKQHNIERRFLIIGITLTAVILVMLWFLLRLRIRKARALTQLNNALSETNATKDKFFNIISHDLKNPAISQREAIKILNDKGSQMDSATLQEYYSELLISADSQVTLLNNLLDWASLQTSRLICQPQKFDIGHEIISDLALIRKMAVDKGVFFYTEIPSQTIVTADAGMISTVIRNLLSNAI